MTDAVRNLLSFIDRSPTPFHAAANAADMLEAGGFSRLREEDSWKLEPGGRYFVCRGAKSVLAFTVGTEPPAEAGARIVVAHTDSPNLKVKPTPGEKARDQSMLAVCVYGSPLMHSWLDRDLALTGGVYLQDGQGRISCVRVDLPDVLVRMNSLAPHLKQSNKTDQVTVDRGKDLRVTFSAPDKAVEDRLRGLLADAAGTGQRLLSWDLSLADTQPSDLCGVDDEFISAPRQDNLTSTYTSLRALIDAPRDVPFTRAAIAYDVEEIGSGTWTGAKSNMIDMMLRRIGASFGGTLEDDYRARARSVILSADMAHSEHPTHLEATDPHHVPLLNKGIAIKSSTRANYAIGYGAEAWFRAIGKEAGLEFQEFMYRCDHGGGSSVGPYTTTDAGIQGLDLGAPLLSMHSIREMGGVRDVEHALKAFGAAYASDIPCAVI